MNYFRRMTSWLCLISVLSMLLSIMPSYFAHSAGAASSWLNSSDVALTSLGTLPGTSLPPDTINGNIDCTKQDLVIKPEIRKPGLPPIIIQHEQSVESCVVQTAFGVLDGRASRVQLGGTDVAGLMTNYTGATGFIAIPHSAMIVSIVNGTMKFTRHPISALDTSTNYLTGEVSYHLNQAPDILLTDHDLHVLQVNYDSISFSSNGQWMVVNSPGLAMLRVNLINFTVVPFAPAIDYQTGNAPNPQTSITNDGKYIAVGSSSQGIFKLYDLAGCDTIPATVTKPNNCQSRDLWAIMQAKVNGFTSLSTVRFIDDDILDMYAGSRTPTSNFQITKYNLSPNGHTSSQLSYLGLGDSFSSGEGAYSYIQGTDSANNRCHLSQYSYPFVIAGKLNSNSFHSVACSGATMQDITGTGDNYAGQVKDKIPIYTRDVNSYLTSFMPGFINQMSFVQHYTPQAMTIGIGGNDVGFSDIIVDCVANVIHGSCYSGYEDRLELFQSINAQYTPLTALYAQMMRDAAIDSRIYAVGYPQIIVSGGNCADNVHLNSYEANLAISLVDQLNEVIKAAATSAGVQYVDVSKALEGHRLCETKSSDVAVNGLTIGNDIPGILHGPLANESYHPNELGQRLIASTILSASQNLTLVMPKRTTSKPAQAADNSALIGATAAGRRLNKVVTAKITDEVIKTGQAYHPTVDTISYGLARDATYTIAANGQSLGSAMPDNNGGLTFTINLPSNTPTGYQLVTVSGPNLTGETIVIQQVVYITGSPSATTCPVQPSGHDIDQDGIDDACDGFISSPPVAPSSATQASANPTSTATTATTSAQAGNTSSNTTTPNTSSVQTPPTNLASNATAPDAQQPSQPAAQTVAINTGSPSNTSSSTSSGAPASPKLLTTNTATGQPTSTSQDPSNTHVLSATSREPSEATTQHQPTKSRPRHDPLNIWWLLLLSLGACGILAIFLTWLRHRRHEQ